MGHPKVGMHFDDVKKRVTRIKKNVPEGKQKERLMDSLVNQAGLAEGEGAKKEIRKAIHHSKPSGPRKYFFLK